MTKPTFDSVRQTRARHAKGCPICGERNTGTVGVALTKLGPTGAKQGAAGVCSKSLSMCEGCAVGVYMALEEDLLKRASG